MTARLLLRPRRVEEADVYRRLWTERDPRVPDHRRIDASGQPDLAAIAAYLRTEQEGPGLGLLAVLRKDVGDVVGYCGLVTTGNGSPEEPELAFELLSHVHGSGYATEAGGAVVAWADRAGHERLWAGVRAWNIASRRVLVKLGFRESGQVERDPVHGDSLLMVRTAGRASR
ncbi:GNAT family N-acetyltransferase [Aquipuribacter hungaricus]|uniref:GNAT family N-acetyltransferase n=1 Tax=Aquipuribacter hungaricus TaxID=545624 RepID=A0ABV7WG46_9MICO